jgi:diguanylate cyclase (GGDEF)-like protein
MPSEINSDYPHNAQPPEITPSDQYQEGYDNYMEIQQLKKAKQEAEKKVFIDALTGCYNQDAWIDFQKHFDSLRGDKTTVILIDLNGFKAINDTLGHLAGDDHLKSVSAYLKETFSRKGDRVFRIGGDEFAIACNFIEPDKREEFNSFVDSCFNHETLDQKKLDFSYGIAFSKSKEPIKDTIKRADETMYKDKEEWKNQHPDRYPKR